MASPPRDEPPILMIFAGPNGSGKSSSYTDALTKLEGRTIWIVNPDLLTARIQKAEGLALQDANLAAVQRLEAWLETSLDLHKSVGVETVLSTAKYRRLVEKARNLGFEVWLFYVLLQSPELNIERVRLRVLKGGHDVAPDDIRRRFWKSLDQLPWFLDKADRASLYDNSGAEPLLVGIKENGVVRLEPDAPEVLLKALA